MELESVILFATGFIFSLFCLADLKQAIDEQKPPVIGLISGFISTVLWFVFGIVWVGGAETEMFITLGYMWMAFGFIFLIVSIGCVGFLLKYTISASKERKTTLEITERE